MNFLDYNFQTEFIEMIDKPHDVFSQVYKRADDIVARKIADEVLLVPIRRHVDDLVSIYLLNEVAVVAWDLFDGQRSLAEVCSHIRDAFAVDEMQAGNDLLELVAQLERIGVLARI